MTEDELSAIQKRCDAASAGPWFSDYHPGGFCGAKMYRDAVVSSDRTDIAKRPNWPKMQKQELADGQFIAHARTDLPKLLAEVRRLRVKQQTQFADLLCLLSYAQDGCPVPDSAINRIRKSIGWHEVDKRQDSRSGMAAIMGKWPGDETDEEIKEALDDIS